MKASESEEPIDPRAGHGAERSAIDWAARSGCSGDLLRELEKRSARRRRRAVLLSISTAVVLTVFSWRAWSVRGTDFSSAKTVVVAQPEQQVLSDGSVVEFNPGTIVSIAFSDMERRVVLQQGEAFFNVATDSARPFVVVAGSVEFRAVGTAFAVQLRDATVEVVVTEGRVAVNSLPDANDVANVPQVTATLVDAGQRARVEGIGPRGAGATCQVDVLSDAELVTAQGWRVPRLEFSGTSLAEALPLFNLHSSVQLVLDDPSLGRLRLSGIIRADNTDALLRLLETSLNITAEHRSDGEIRLRRDR